MTTHLEPVSLLDALKSIEQDIGRTAGPRWGPRVIDLDILLYGPSGVHRDDRLIVPHERLHERNFALRPVCECVAQAARDCGLRGCGRG